jgi:hypothetical protein
MNFRPLSEYRRHGRACWRPDPVANDPERTLSIGSLDRSLPFFVHGME